MVAVMVHELCHVQLLGNQHVHFAEPDNEPLTDLASVFFGFGIFMANAKFQVTRRGWQTLGYLPTAQLCFGLAMLYSRENDDDLPTWLGDLKGTPRASFKRSLAWLRPKRESKRR